MHLQTFNVLQQGTAAIESKVFKLANSLASLKKLVEQLGSTRDTVSHRHKVAAANAVIQSSAKEIKDRLTSMHGETGTSPEQQAKLKKLLQDFTTMLQDYKATQKVAAEREAASLPRPDPQAVSSAAVLDSNMNDEEREKEVNEMFQDLAVLINDQGVQIITIDEHITSTAERTKDGASELVKASRSQVAARNSRPGYLGSSGPEAQVEEAKSASQNYKRG
eukprot:gene29059-32264_t